MKALFCNQNINSEFRAIPGYIYTWIISNFNKVQNINSEFRAIFQDISTHE